MKKMIYNLYRKFDKCSVLATIVNYLYIVILPRIKGNAQCKYNDKKTYKVDSNNIKKRIKDIKIAFICDDMTYKSFKDECTSIFLTPSNWLDIMQEFKPDIFFCESTWNGINKYKDCWRGRIYKNKYVKFNNRKVLFDILDYCRKTNVKTVFWNKEDPIYFDNLKNNFSDTALHFDYIFTTAKECVKEYKKLGHKNVYTLMFGFNEKIFNPINSNNKINKAIFAGSWFNEHLERCNDMKNIFKMVQEKGIPLEIYDRNFGTSNYLKMFPDKYKEILHKAVPFEKLQEIYKESQFAININTIKNSETMFARRVFELMACNTYIISNYSKGMKKIFGKNVCFLDEDFDLEKIKEICEENVQYVMDNHTNRKRLKSIYDIVGIEYIDESDQIAFFYDNWNIEDAKRHFNCMDYKNRKFYRRDNNEIFDIDNNKVELNEVRKSINGCYAVSLSDGYNGRVDFEKAISHMSYLDESIGIKFGKNKYTIEKSLDYHNSLFKGKKFYNIISNNLDNYNIYTI